MAYRSSSTNSGTGVTLSTAVPTGAASGDIMILLGSVDQQAASFTNWPTGFTSFADIDLTGDGQSVGVAWKRLTAADTGTYSITLTSGTGTPDWVMQAVCLSGRHATTAPTISTTATNNAANASPVTVTANGVTAASGDDLVYLAALDTHAAVVASFTPPSGYSERQDTQSGWCAQTIATLDNVSAGATGSVSSTATLASSTAGWAAWVINVPAAGAASLTSNPADNVGITDSVTALIGFMSSLADPVGITDAVTTTRILNISISDSVGITDTGAPQAIDFGINLSDNVGVTDNVTASSNGSSTVTPSDPVGITDSVATTVSAVQNPAESVGITDAVSVATTFDRQQPESVGITDSVSANLTTAGGGSVFPADPVGVTDAVTLVRSVNVTISDGVGITDAASGTSASARYRVVTPTHEEPMRTHIEPLNHYRLTHALSLVKLGGQWQALRLLSLDPAVVNTLVDGSTLFRGGYEYVVTQAISDELIAAGFPTVPVS